MKRVVALFAVLGVIVVSAAGCGGDSESEAEAPEPSATGTEEAPAEGEPFVIGMASAQTGFMSFYDVPEINGAKIAADDFNAEGGVLGRPIEFVLVDSKSDPAASATAAQQLVDQGISAMVTISDYDLGGPAARIAGENGIIAFGSAGSPKYGRQGLGELAFNTDSGTPTQGASAAQAVQSQGWKSPYLLEDTSLEYTKSLCTYFTETWTELTDTDVVGRDTFGQGDPSVATQITRIKNTSPQPDVIVLCSYPPGGATVIRQIRAAGIETPIMTFQPFDGSFWTEAVPNVSGVFHLAVGSMYGDDPRPEVNRFFEEYEKRFGEPPISYALFGYADVELIVKAAEKANSTDPADIAKAIEQMTDEDTILGPTTYSADCHQPAGRGFPLMRWENGEDSFVEFIEPEYVPEAIC